MAGFVAVAVVVVNGQPFALQDGAGDGLEVVQMLAAGGHGEDADALLRLSAAQVFGLEQRLKPGADGGKGGIEQARLDGLQQVIQGHQGVQFLAGKPQTGKGVAAIGGVVAVAAALTVADDRRTELVAQVGYQTGEGSSAKLKTGPKLIPTNAGPSPIQFTVQPIEIIEFAHSKS